MLFAPKEKGQGLVEYALIIVLVAIVVIVILVILGLGHQQRLQQHHFQPVADTSILSQQGFLSPALSQGLRFKGISVQRSTL